MGAILSCEIDAFLELFMKESESLTPPFQDLFPATKVFQSPSDVSSFEVIEVSEAENKRKRNGNFERELCIFLQRGDDTISGLLLIS